MDNHKKFLSPEEQKKIHILFMPTLVPAIVHYRMANYVKELRNDPLLSVAFSYNKPSDYKTCAWEKNLRENQRFIAEMEVLCGIADIVIFQSVHTDEAMALIHALKARFPHLKVVAEYDDSLFAVPSYNPSSTTFSPEKIPVLIGREQLRNADAIVVSTDYLKHEFMNLNQNIFTVPNSIDFTDKAFNREIRPSKKHTYIRIGWVGGGAHNGDLKILRKIMPVILEKYPRVKFEFHGGAAASLFPKHERISTDESWHDITDHLSKIRKYHFDIGIAPLRDNEFNRSKSNLRVLEYSALKIPTIASHVEPYAKLRTESGNAFITVKETKTVSLEKAWIDAISYLVKHPEKRTELGTKMQKFVKKNYSVQAITPKYIQALKMIHSWKSRTPAEAL